MGTTDTTEQSSTDLTSTHRQPPASIRRGVERVGGASRVEGHIAICRRLAGSFLTLTGMSFPRATTHPFQISQASCALPDKRAVKAVISQTANKTPPAYMSYQTDADKLHTNMYIYVHICTYMCTLLLFQMRILCTMISFHLRKVREGYFYSPYIYAFPSVRILCFYDLFMILAVVSSICETCVPYFFVLLKFKRISVPMTLVVQLLQPILMATLWPNKFVLMFNVLMFACWI